MILLTGPALVRSETETGNGVLSSSVTASACEVELRVATYNIHGGTPGSDCRDPAPDACVEDLARIGQVLADLDVDIVGLQEVESLTPHCTAPGEVIDQTSVLASQLGMQSCFGPNIPLNGGTFGNAILSRVPLLSCDNTLLPSAPNPNVDCVSSMMPLDCCTGEGEGNCDPGQQRGLLRTDIEVDGVPFVFFNTHLQVPGVIHREIQTQVIAGHLDATAGPVVLVGDMNAKSHWSEMTPLNERLLDAFVEAGVGEHRTAAACALEKRIDYVFVSDDVEVSLAQVATEGDAAVASDHLAVISDIVIPGPNQVPHAICQNVTVAASADECTAEASIDGGSFDPCGDPLSLSQIPAGPYGLGATMVALEVEDDRGGSASCAATVTVVDETPPTIDSVTATPSTLWPPNHMLIPVSVDVVVEDACDPSPTCAIIDITSSEAADGKGDGATAFDTEVTGSLTANLRAERSGLGSERVYTLTIECSDGAGNRSSAPVDVSVSHHQ
jgi:endonuclease/exonuclease/phosphatase family metal-dependent hydrolase